MIRILKYIFFATFFLIVFVACLNWYINISTKKDIFHEVRDIPTCYTALVLGAHVSRSGEPSDFLRDRLDKAVELYQHKKVKKLLLSGDHGRKDYDEVNHMKSYLLEKGIDTRDIFTDHAGFDTYNSLVRAREIFGVSDVIVVTQQFHLPRALYIASMKNLRAFGMVADKNQYASLQYLQFREIIACVKAFMEVSFYKQPKYLGEKIPINGDSSKSYD